MDKYLFADGQRALMEGMEIPFAIYQFINKRVVTLILSDGFCELFGYDDRAEAYYDMDNDMYKDVHPDDVARIADDAFRFATEGGKYEVIYRTRKKNSSEYKIVHAMGKHVYTDTGVRLAHVWYTDEGTYTEEPGITENELNKAMNNALHEESIVNASNYDVLTGLPRMTYFFELAEEGRKVIQEEGGKYALLFLDFSGMKFFNSTNGFAAGDKLIKEFSRVLVRIFSNENCCHVGGDHFAVYTTEGGLEERLADLFEETDKLNEGNSLPVRVGIYRDDMGCVPISTAVDRAKYACDGLRNNYGSAYNYFESDMLDRAYLRQYVVSHFDRALSEGWIKVYYQPIVRAINGRACDEEALARWIDPDKGFLSPADFIPHLESVGILYKLDLYVLEQVLIKINRLKELGMPVVPQSINLSRSDFDACDMVEEIRSRVDEAGVCRNLITIEITESVIGSDFDDMKEQIMRFRELGFPVWMDDFGSGYSSLDVLEGIPFDLIKFDMSFMQRLDKGTRGKVILTELMKMATALGVDTVCEGIETEEQVHFLQEIGCSKLQGYYYQKPVPPDTVFEKFKTGFRFGFENPEEADYYDSIGRVNLYDLAFIVSEEAHALNNVFNTIPMGILEVEGEDVCYVRSNQAYRDFMARYFGRDSTVSAIEAFGKSSASMAVLKECCQGRGHAFFDEKMADGSVIHLFARKISSNPVTGKDAVAVAMLSVSEPSDGTTYSDIARALSANYYSIYYVDLDTDQFIEYSSPTGSEELAMERRGEDFFNTSRKDAVEGIYKDDLEMFLQSFDKESIIKALDADGVFGITYRIYDNGEPVYVTMKVTRMTHSNRVIIGVSVVDYQMRQKQRYDKLKKERDAMIGVMALSDVYLSMFTIDPDTGNYTEYSSSDDFNSLGAAKSGDDFFAQAIVDSAKYFYPEDIPVFQMHFTKENVMKKIRENGKFTIDYRLMIDGKPKPVSMIVAPFKDGSEEKLIAGVRESK